MNFDHYDAVGQKLSVGSLLYIVATSGSMVFGRVIALDQNIHVLCRTFWGSIYNVKNPNRFCVIPSTQKTKPWEEELDKHLEEEHDDQRSIRL